MRRVVGGILSYGAAALFGALLTLILTGLVAARPAPQTVRANALASPDALSPFRLAGLQASPPQPITADSPCYLPELLPLDALQFTAVSPVDRFCLMRFTDLDSRDRVWQLFAGRQGLRVTVRGGALLVYLGSSSAVAYRYESIFATIP